MSVGSELVAIGSQLKHWISFASVFLSICIQLQLFCLHLCPKVSMRLRPRRTCSGVDCWGFSYNENFLSFLVFKRASYLRIR